jgi:hypothetical protein
MRVRIAEERTILTELEAQFKHEPMKNWVRRTLADLLDIERVLSSFDDGRCDEDEAQLRWAKVRLEWAAERREQLKAAIENHGPESVMMFPIPNR